MFVVALRADDAGGARGLRRVRWEGRGSTPGEGAGAGFNGHVASVCLRAGRGRRCRVISLMHLFGGDSLKGWFWDQVRKKAPGFERVTMSEYEARTDESIRVLLRGL
jgi:hypothetical protein